MNSQTDEAKPAKPAKPSKDFPLYAHSKGQWAKKIRGKTYYFGPWDDPQGALHRYHLHMKQMDFEAERERQAERSRADRLERNDLTVGEVWNAYLAYQEKRVDSGDLSRDTLTDYGYLANTIRQSLGASVKVADLTPRSFADLRLAIVGKYAPARSSKLVTVCRQVFKWAYESELISQPVRFGPDFKVISQKQHRVHRANSPKKLFTPAQISSLHDAADAKWKLAILLGLNCAFGNSDIANLKLQHVHFGDGGLGDLLDATPIDRVSYIEMARSKTGIERRIPLWDITSLRLKRYIVANPPGSSGLIFTTRTGLPMIRFNASGLKADSTVQGFQRLRKKAGLDCGGFYWLRHTFQTIAEETKDLPAVAAVMGHADHSMAANYREEVKPERIAEVVLHVAKWFHQRGNTGMTG